MSGAESKIQSSSKLGLSRQSYLEEGFFAGIHLSGANARKSALVLLEVKNGISSLSSLYEKIGSSGTLFSDDRILNILNGIEEEILEVFVDCPLTEPPCVSCVRPSCPGAVRCDDLSVAMMLSSESQRGRKGAHKLRPLNPQQQRLWDVLFARAGSFGPVEPSYSSNIAPLVVRAKTLQRRLNSLSPGITLKETNVPIVVAQLALIFSGNQWQQGYRNFERGRKLRETILEKIILSGISDLKIQMEKRDMIKISSSVELFQAFIAAAVAVWKSRGLTKNPPEFFKTSSGWVEVLEMLEK